ncbi:hypothetical protein KSC_028770 [Ktedonobacter sp. SOSP1-52]|nr:hypothetical protein KSC_028770 [Ktedonobacter sp. SOSP1-52]
MIVFVVYAGIFMICLIIQFVLHWGNLFSPEQMVKFLVGSVAVAFLNMLLWWLFVVIPKSATLKAVPKSAIMRVVLKSPRIGLATVAGFGCGVFAPDVLADADVLFGWLVHGYFLDEFGQHTTSWADLCWSLTTWPIFYAVAFGWFLLPVCILLDRWMVEQVFGKQ